MPLVAHFSFLLPVFVFPAPMFVLLFIALRTVLLLFVAFHCPLLLFLAFPCSSCQPPSIGPELKQMNENE